MKSNLIAVTHENESYMSLFLYEPSSNECSCSEYELQNNTSILSPRNSFNNTGKFLLDITERQ